MRQRTMPSRRAGAPTECIELEYPQNLNLPGRMSASRAAKAPIPGTSLGIPDRRELK